MAHNEAEAQLARALALLETTADGKVVNNVALGCTVVPVADTAVVLRIHFAASPEEAAAGGRSAQASFSPQEALRLAESSTRAANRLLAPHRRH